MNDPASVAATEQETPVAAPVPAAQRAVAGWLFALGAMVFAMIVLGGYTRLTYSGLSMVDWRPLTGWLPPLSQDAWEAAFAQYRRFPEYREVNAGMSLAGFKAIFWIEYLHRLWGRLIGLAFAVPFAVFLWRGWIGRRLALGLLGLFVLGGLQGFMGWYMVQSGLVDRPDVSAYRLTAHLGFALLILGLMLWLALGRLFPRAEPVGMPRARGLRRLSWAAAAAVFVTALSGGLVAGNDAGLVYNTFPKMNGEWVPAEILALESTWINFFENLATVQFDHRLLALATTLIILALAVAAWRSGLGGRPRAAVGLLVLAVAGQVTLGISTLLMAVPLSLALAHQAWAVVLFAAALWVAFELRGAGERTARAESGA